uniref:Inter-alpha-trypsin inhibitor heavy chain family member 6 n=1 Tax=Cyprinus carpio carpio TaxID=630221 RepID=A0A8C1CUS3_CYPCA
MDVKLDLTIHAVFFILLTVVPFGCAHFDAQSVPLQLKVTDYHVRCSVVSRYAVTTVESTVWNQLHITKEAAFEVDLSSSAFISNFTITSNGKVYVAQVKRRTDARKIYDTAKKQGKTAGLVATKEREIEKFRVAVNVPPGTRVSFSLTYEELLSRRLGRYELSLGLRPGQPVQNLSLDVSMSERTGISFIRALPLRTSRLLTSNAQVDADPPPSTKVEQNPYCAHVHYTPTIQQQKKISPRGLNADFIIQYDVELKDPIGDIQVDDGYFVHYFAPRGLPVVPKDVIFVIDISGSMIGTKMKQTKAAMTTILSDLREGDYFNLITFSDKVHTWKKGRTVRATRQNVRDAKEFVRKIIAEGWTNINAALLSAAQLLNPSSHSSSSTGRASSSHRVPMIIFLTDGEATIGETEPDVILRNAQNALGLASLFGLAFGDDADFPMLRRLAMENRGVARMVYEDDDAAVQLKGFYDEVASPLLSDIQLSYLDEQVYDITRSLFPNYFQGSELVVTGRLKPGVQDLKVTLTANDSKQKVRVENELPLAKAVVNGTEPSLGCAQALDGIPSFVHRLWAYFTIKELLLAKINTSDVFIQRRLVDKATNLSLKYNFVTPVTSLVVIKPDINEPEPTISSSVVATTSKTSTITIAGSTNVTNQTSHYFVSLKVDGDPHFVVQLPKLHQDLCFTVDGRADDVLRLLVDPDKGFMVYHPIYSLLFRYSFNMIDVSCSCFIPVIPVPRHGMRITVEEHHSCWIELGVGVQFLILFHHYNHPKYFQMEHLGFYIADGKGLSHLTEGLLGQFQHTLMEVIRVSRDQANFHHAQTNKNTSLATGLLKKGDEHFPVTLQDKILKDSSRKRHSAQCWVVPKVDMTFKPFLHNYRGIKGTEKTLELESFFYLTVKKQLMGERIGIYTSCDELKDDSEALTGPNICI